MKTISRERFSSARACYGLVCLCVLQSFVPGCFSTLYSGKWDARRRPERLEKASVESGTRVTLTVMYKTGKAYRVEADLPPGPLRYFDQTLVSSKFIERDHPVSSQAIPLVPSVAEGGAQEWFGLASASTGTAYVHHGKDRFGICLPPRAPLNWLSPETYLELLLVPVPVALDVVTFPGQLIAFTMDPNGFQRLMTSHPSPSEAGS